MRAVIVGAGDIGSAIGRRLRSAGASVTTTYRRHRSEEFESIQLDITSPEDVQRVFTDIGAFDTLVIAAGHRHELQLLTDQPVEVTEEIVRTELLGPMNVVRAALRTFDDHGRIVIIGSDSGKAGTLGDAASSAARAGLMGFVRSVARETARRDITINIVNPGPIGSSMLSGMLEGEGLTAKVMGGTIRAIPKGRLGTVDEIAEAVAYLVGPHSGFTTGQVLSVSGGLTM